MFAAKLADVQNNEASSWLPESAESTRAFEKLEPFQDPNAIPTVVVYQRAGGLTEADLAAIEAQAVDFAAMDGLAEAKEGRAPSVVSPATAEQLGFPAVSENGEVAQTSVTFDLGSEGWNKMPDIADELRDIARIDGVDVYVAGAGGQAADSAEAFGGIDTTLLGATLGIVILILLFTYRSPILWILPIFSAVVALFVSQALIYFLAKYADLTVNGQSYAILTILVIGAGTDYALLLVARYREELRRHEDRHEAMAFALHRAAPALLASAMTVALGMLCLLFAEMNSTKGLGPVAAIGIAVTFVVMVTLLPALLVITGRWIFWPPPPGLRLGRADPDRRLGQGGALDRAATAQGLGGHLRPPRDRLPRPVGPRHRRARDRGLLHQGLPVDHRPAGAGGRRPGRPVQHRDGGEQRRQRGRDRATP